MGNSSEMGMHSLEQARAAMLAGLEPMAAESVLLAQAAGRVLAADVAAVVNLPRFDNSAMDGYAVIASDVSSAAEASPVTTHGGKSLPIGLNNTGACHPAVRRIRLKKIRTKYLSREMSTV